MVARLCLSILCFWSDLEFINFGPRRSQLQKDVSVIQHVETSEVLNNRTERGCLAELNCDTFKLCLRASTRVNQTPHGKFQTEM